MVKPLPMPDFSNVFKPTCTHSHTMPEPFSFENKYPLKEELVKELVKKDNEEAAKVGSLYKKMMYYVDVACVNNFCCL